MPTPTISPSVQSFKAAIRNGLRTQSPLEVLTTGGTVTESELLKALDALAQTEAEPGEDTMTRRTWELKRAPIPGRQQNQIPDPREASDMLMRFSTPVIAACTELLVHLGNSGQLTPAARDYAASMLTKINGDFARQVKGWSPRES